MQFPFSGPFACEFRNNEWRFDIIYDACPANVSKYCLFYTISLLYILFQVGGEVFGLEADADPTKVFGDKLKMKCSFPTIEKQRQMSEEEMFRQLTRRNIADKGCVLYRCGFCNVVCGTASEIGRHMMGVMPRKNSKTKRRYGCFKKIGEAMAAKGHENPWPTAAAASKVKMVEVPIPDHIIERAKAYQGPTLE